MGEARKIASMVNDHSKEQNGRHPRNVRRSDIVKVDSGSYDVLTEQGSSASQMDAVSARMPRYVSV